MIKRILVPLDGSAFAECALPLALALCERSGADLRLAMVNEPLNLPPGTWAEAFLSNHLRYIDSITSSMENRVAPPSRTSSVLLEGEVARALCEEATASDPVLVRSERDLGLSHGPACFALQARHPQDDPNSAIPDRQAPKPTLSIPPRITRLLVHTAHRSPRDGCSTVKCTSPPTYSDR